ncbi:MAG: hypothetical protein SP1CHLAM54_17240 [Chlamydiia bacterium]|nr:hypothetical protein [Chlamydiia bacterium]MCH9616612.1 hypothetical protein [Chlamydiia bacterium]
MRIPDSLIKVLGELEALETEARSHGVPCIVRSDLGLVKEFCLLCDKGNKNAEDVRRVDELRAKFLTENARFLQLN